MTSDGYQTFNYQDRKAFSAKYQYADQRQRPVDRVLVGRRSAQQHAGPEGLDARAARSSSATTS